MANGDYNTQWGCRKNIFGQKIFDNSFRFQAMVLTSKWGRIQPEIQIVLWLWRVLWVWNDEGNYCSFTSS